MDWTKIPTNLLNGKFDDKEILAIVKYQLVYALYEEDVNDKILSRFLTKKQKNIAKNFIADITANVKSEVEAVHKKRSSNKLYYAKNRGKLKNSDILQDDLQDDCQPEQIKNREEKNKEEEKEIHKEKEDENFSDLNSSFDEWFKNYPKPLGKVKAFEEYKKAIESGATKEELLEGAIRYAAYVKDECTDIQYIKYADNWLKQSCWQDVYISSKQLAEQKQKEYEEEQRRLEEERKIIHLEEEKERQEQERLRKLEEEKKIEEGSEYMGNFIASGKSAEFLEGLKRKHNEKWANKIL